MSVWYAVGIKIGRKADQIAVEAEDALIAAGILLAHVGDGGLGVSALDFECGNQCGLCLHGDLIRRTSYLDSNGIPDAHACSFRERAD